jgi:hypothetical protein
VRIKGIKENDKEQGGWMSLTGTNWSRSFENWSCTFVKDFAWNLSVNPSRRVQVHT